MISSLIDAKIEKALANSAVSQINAESEAFKNRIKRMEQINISIKERRAAMEPALHSCEKILVLFHDENFCLWKAVIPSSQFMLMLL